MPISSLPFAVTVRIERGIMTTDLRVVHLRVEYREAPVGIDVRQPRLSWQIVSSRRNTMQGAWQVLAASTAESLQGNKGDLWDSGRVEGSQSTHIPYAGSTLQSRQQVWWKVRIWDELGTASEWSEAATWEMGLLKQVEWQGRWMSLPGISPDLAIEESRELDALLPVTLLRRQFTISRPLLRATLYATARGVYVPHLNGGRIGDHVLSPGWTDYQSRIQYQTFDVTAAILPGENVIGAEVGTGWFAGYVGWHHLSRHFGTVPQFLMQLHLDYADGSSDVIASDGDWVVSTGPTRYADLIMGEWHDARLASDWDTAGFDTSDWTQVQLSAVGAVPLVADSSEPVRAMEEIVPLTITEPESGRYIFDLGQNIAGWARLRVEGASGTRITLRFAEILNPDGTLYITNLRSARATDTYILSGNGVEVWEPSFCWHGFRYVEVTGLPVTPDLTTITGRFVGSDTVSAGTFRCSDDLVNTLQDNIVRGQRGNFLSIPTDCPQRDERLGWLGDAQVFVGTAVGNMQVAAFFSKWMRDVVDAQGEDGAFPDVAPRAVVLSTGAPAWADAGVIVPWTIWRTYGDTAIVNEHWVAMTRWMNWLENGNPDFLWRHDRGNDFGDWLSIKADTPKELIGTAYWAYDARLMAEMAECTNRPDEAAHYRDIFSKVKAAFQRAYLQSDGSLLGGTQTTYCLALHFGLLDDHQIATAVQLLVDDIEAKGWHLSTGFVGVSYLCHVLTANGRADVAYRLLHQESFPSWKYSIRHGATTIWERWDGWTEESGFQDPGMNSFNHYSLGSVGEWLRRSVAGIDQVTGSSGYQRLQIAPVVDASLDWVDATFESTVGLVHSRWHREPDGIHYDLEIPANATAEVVLIADSTSLVSAGITDSADGTSTSAGARTDSHVHYSIGSGQWSFVVGEPAQ